MALVHYLLHSARIVTKKKNRLKRTQKNTTVESKLTRLPSICDAALGARRTRAPNTNSRLIRHHQNHPIRLFDAAVHVCQTHAGFAEGFGTHIGFPLAEKTSVTSKN